MMNQEKIGKFMADLRKEKKMTQEQFAEKLGVSNRSVSRWENGKTMPDLSMFPIISEELEVSMAELLEGERQKEKVSEKDNIGLVIELSDYEKRKKAKKLNRCFLLGLICIVIVILDGQFEILNFIEDYRIKNFLLGLLTGLGITFELVGFYYNSRERKLTERELAVLTADENSVRMKSAQEMIQFAKKRQQADLKQYEKAFQAIVEKLEQKESVMFSMVGDALIANEGWKDSWKPWHVGIAVTEERLMVCGEAIHGRFMTFYDVESFSIRDIRKVWLESKKIVMEHERVMLTIEGKQLENVVDLLKNAVKK